MIKIIKKITYLSITLSILLNSFLYATPTDAGNIQNDNGGVHSKGYLDTTDALREEPGKIVGDLIVTGDSYGGYFVSFLKAFYGYNIDKNSYCRPQMTVVENHEIYELAFITKYNNVVLSIGFNDYVKQTDLTVFYDYIVKFAKLARLYNKRLILHSYLAVPFSYPDEKYSYIDYDLELRKIAYKFDNVEYIDITDVQNRIDYLLEDGIHYNEKMYIVLYNRISELLNKLQEESKIIIYNK